MTDANRGHFVWYELMTDDTSAAIAFYTHVIGWKTQPLTESPEPYTMWVAGQGPLGGVMRLPETARRMGTPPHWMAHVQVGDVDATVVTASRLGAHVHVPPTDISTVGRYAVIADPFGASIALFKPNEPMTLHDSGKPGEFTWRELLTTDQRAAFHFYRELFGWEKTGEHDMGPMGVYLLFGFGTKMLGGIMNKPKESPMPPAWLYYVMVEDLDVAFDRAKAKGARVLYEPMEIPDGSRVSALLDPHGVAFALLGPGIKK
jgi:predicted enzyme related to lactoylglutathione lyase